jgi:ATP-dependent DNA helicase RecQ
VKLEKYGKPYKSHNWFSKKQKTKKEASTYKETLQLYQNGLTPDEIAIERKPHHITYCKKLYVDGVVARPFPLFRWRNKYN